MFDRFVTRLRRDLKRLAGRLSFLSYAAACLCLPWKTIASKSVIDGADAGSATPSEAAPNEQLLYQYSTIDSAKCAFRLLILRGGTGQDIDCELVDSILDGNGHLPYEAVSYTWGPNLTAEAVKISGKKLPVTFNLSLILRDLRFADADRVIWVDAICINQQDATEKGPQVAQMQNIYALAERVLFCIARPTDYTNLLMDSLERLQNELQTVDQRDDSAIRACWSTTQTSIASHHLNCRLQPSAETFLSAQLEALTFLQRQGLEYTLGQPWFHRVWILQEVANARDALVHCGQKSVSAAVFVLGARLLEYSLPDERRKTVDQVLNLMPGHERKDPSQDILSLFRRFGKANATVERDRIYALFGICEDKKIQTHIIPDYLKSEQEVIIDTIAYLCHCEVSVVATSPYDSIAHFLADLDLFDDTSLSHFMRSGNYKGALQLLQSRGHYISVTPDLLNMATNTTMMEEGVMSQLLEQGNADSRLLNREGWKPLCFAAEHGYDTLVRQVLEKGAFRDAPSIKMYGVESLMTTPLPLAAMNGHENVVKILLETCEGVLSRFLLEQSRGETALAWAARNGHTSIVQLLVEKGSSVEKDLENRSPLSWAASEGYEAIVGLLLKHGADPTRKTSDGHDTPLSRAAENGHKVIVQSLLDNPVKFDSPSMEFALICAARAAQISIVSLLLDTGAGNDLLDILDAAVEKTWEGDDRREDFKAIAMMILAKGAHFRENSKPLVRAAAAGNEQMVRLFLDYGAKLDYMGTRFINGYEGNYSGTALSFAIRYGHKDLSEVLLNHGANLEARDSHERTPLLVAARSGHESIVKMLLEKGADIGVRDRDGQPPFNGTTSVETGAVEHWNIVKLLLERMPDAAVRECNGEPLLCAAGDGRGDIVEMLLARGADIDPRDHVRDTPLLRATREGHVDVIRVLLKNGADIEVRRAPEAHTPLHIAAQNGYENTVRVLLENGADTEVRGPPHKLTPLHFAAWKGHETVVKVLLENGADIEARDELQQTPLNMAKDYDNDDVVTLLLESGASTDVYMRGGKVFFRKRKKNDML